jgi:hypothetical protein
MFKKLLIGTLCLASVNAFSYANLEINVPSDTAIAGEVRDLKGEITYGIQNNTKVPQTYRIAYDICPQSKQCYAENFSVRLMSGERVQQKFEVSKAVTYGKAGRYNTIVSAQINGESNSMKEGIGLLTVYAR